MTSLDESEQLEYIVSLQRQLQDYKYGVVKKMEDFMDHSRDTKEMYYMILRSHLKK